MPLKVLFFVKDVLHNWISQSKKVAQMYVEEIHFRNCYLNGFGTFDPGDFDIMTQKSIGFLHHQGWMCGPSLRTVGIGVLELLIGNGFGTFDPGDLDL